MRPGAAVARAPAGSSQESVDAEVHSGQMLEQDEAAEERHEDPDRPDQPPSRPAAVEVKESRAPGHRHDGGVGLHGDAGPRPVGQAIHARGPAQEGEQPGEEGVESQHRAQGPEGRERALAAPVVIRERGAHGQAKVG
jgi:hypothetical protein